MIPKYKLFFFFFFYQREMVARIGLSGEQVIVLFFHIPNHQTSQTRRWSKKKKNPNLPILAVVLWLRLNQFHSFVYMLNSYSLIQNQLFSRVLKAKEGKKIAKHILGIHWKSSGWDFSLLLQRTRVWFLDGKPRSHMLQSAEKQNK